jgi:mono/diheme cytochrome c family protein
MRGAVRRAAALLPLLALTACSWFTDFKQQPKIDPWETPADTIPFRGNPQMSVPITGSAAPGFMYDRLGAPQNFTAMAGIRNPVPPDSASVDRGRVQFQINCAVCPGANGMVNQQIMKYGLFPAAIGGANNPAAGYTDGYIFAIIRNGKATMPSYNRIEEMDRWDIINYLRSLQGKLSIAADTSHCRPGETGLCTPAASTLGPTHPAPYYHAGGLTTAPSAVTPGAMPGATPGMPGMTMPTDTAKKSVTDTTKKAEGRP